MRPERIISGGQTGADQGGLYGAEKVGIPTGGTAPKNFMTETGPNPDLGTRFGLVASDSPLYSVRTVKNIENSDGTVIFGDHRSVGSKLTRISCEKQLKPYIVNPTPERLRRWVQEEKIKVLNVAGNRISVNPEAFQQAHDCIVEAFTGV